MSQNYGQHHVYEATQEPDAPGRFVYIEQVEPPQWVRMPWSDFLAMVNDYSGRTDTAQASGPGSGQASGPAAVKGANVAPVSLAPAEQPVESITAAELEAHLTTRREAMRRGEARSSSQAKRNVQPVPKAKP